MADTTLTAHKRGDTWQGISPVTLSINGSPVDITGASIKMQVRKRKCGVDVIGEWSTGDSTITITDAANGEFQVEPRVIGWEAATYYYDIQVTLASGRVLTIVEGTWEITQDVTRG